MEKFVSSCSSWKRKRPVRNFFSLFLSIHKYWFNVRSSFPYAGSVLSIVPVCFEACAKIFVGEKGGGERERPSSCC